MQRLRKPIYIYITVFIIGLIGFSTLFYYLLYKNDELITEATVTLVEEEIESEFPGLHLQTISEENSLYTISMNIPKTEWSSLNKGLEAWTEDEKNLFLKEVKRAKDELSEDNLAHLNINFITEKVNKELYSLILTAEQYIGDSLERTNVFSLIVNIEDGKEVALDDLFNTDATFAKDLLGSIMKVYEKDEKVQKQIDEKTLVRAIEKQNWNIALKESHIHFYIATEQNDSQPFVELKVSLEQLKQHAKKDLTLTAKNEKSEKSKKAKPKKQQKEKKQPKKDTSKKYVALTFDDGPSPHVTPLILETLQEYDAKATFFMIGSRVEYYPSVAKQVADAGHEIANHSLWHPDLTKLSYKQIEAQFEETSNKLEQATGYKPSLIRPPYGAFDHDVEAFAEKGNYAIVLWTVDSLDWKAPNKQFVYDRVISGVNDGAIILMHDIHQVTADALPEIMETLVKEGYHFVTVSELLEILDEKKPGPIYGKM